jgi:hypothetical protein
VLELGLAAPSAAAGMSAGVASSDRFRQSP